MHCNIETKPIGSVLNNATSGCDPVGRIEIDNVVYDRRFRVFVQWFGGLWFSRRRYGPADAGVSARRWYGPLRRVLRQVEAVAHPINRSDAGCLPVHCSQLAADVLDVAVHGTVGHIAEVFMDEV